MWNIKPTYVVGKATASLGKLGFKKSKIGLKKSYIRLVSTIFDGGAALQGCWEKQLKF